jgi:hypothetical protein
MEIKMTNLITYFKSLTSTPSVDAIVIQELEESKRELLKSQAHQEYSAKMVEYHQQKIVRLTKHLKTLNKEQDQP